MNLVVQLLGFGLRQVIGEVTDQVVNGVARRFTDHSLSLTRALVRANDRAWQALGIALAGDGLFDQIKRWFASGEDKGIREQVSKFLASNAFSFEGTSAALREYARACVVVAQAGPVEGQGALSSPIPCTVGTIRAVLRLISAVSRRTEVELDDRPQIWPALVQSPCDRAPARRLDD
jgi:hypothetical protein